MIRIFRHVACEGPGYFADLLQRHGRDYEVITVDAGESVPDSLDGISGLVFLGGPMSVNDPLPWVADELELIRSAQAANIGVLGFCLGSQLISKALGGMVSRGDAGQEIGWHPVMRVDSEVASQWLGELPTQLPAFHWHGETFSLPEGATRILSSAAYANQGFVLGRTLGLQCHPEISAAMASEWSRLYTGDLEQGGQWNQSAEQINDDIESKAAALQPLADTLLGNWLDNLD